MKTITIEKNIYSFNELSEDAKEKARREYLDNYRDTQWFSEDCEYRIKELFPNSELDVEYSLSYCQGDGFNIYGKMAIKDAIDYVMKNSDKLNEYSRFYLWLSKQGYTLYLPQNGRYGYCCVTHENYIYQIIDNMEMDGYTSNSENHIEILSVFDEVFKDLIGKLCKEFEENGYDYFYNTETIDDEINDMLENESFEGFEVDGSIYF